MIRFKGNQAYHDHDVIEIPTNAILTKLTVTIIKANIHLRHNAEL